METRAIAFWKTSQEMNDYDGYYKDVTFISKESTNGKIYEVQILADNLKHASPTPGTVTGNDKGAMDACKTVTVYPYASGEGLDNNIDQEVIGDLEKLMPAIYSLNFTFDDYKTYGEQLASIGMYLYENSREVSKELSSLFSNTSFTLNVIDLAQKITDDLVQGEKIQNSIEALNKGNDAMCLIMHGSVCSVEGGNGNTLSIEHVGYDENELAIRIAAYNTNNGRCISVDSLIDSYNEASGIYDGYYEWYYGEDAKDEIEYYKNALNEAAKCCGYSSLNTLNSYELNKTINIVMTALQDRGENAVSASNYAEICEAIKENCV